MTKKAIILLVFVCLHGIISAQSLVSMTPNQAIVPTTLTTTVTSTGFYFTQSSQPQTFNTYLYQNGNQIFPNWINVLDDDHFDMNWTFPTGSLTGVYDLYYDYFIFWPWPQNVTAILPGAFTLIDTCHISALPASGTVCQGDSVKLTFSPAATYQWRLNGVNIAGANSSVYYAKTSGSYTMVSTGGGCTGPSSPFVVNILTIPTATISPSGAQTICKGQTFTLQASTGVGYYYQWRKNGAPISGAIASSYNVTETGVYTVSISNSGYCTVTSASTTVTVYEITALPIAALVCQGDSVKLSFSTGTTFQWKLNGVNIPGATSSIYYAKTSGSYTVATTGGGCNNPLAVTVTIIAFPAATLSPAGTQNICKGQTVTLQANTGVGLTYQWLKNGTLITGAVSNAYVVKDQGVYKVIVTNLQGCATTSNGKTVNVNELPLVTVSKQPGSASGKDADLNSYNPNNNYGTTVAINVLTWTINGTPISSRSYLQFDLSSIPPGSNIYSATLSLYFDSSSTSGNHTQYGDNKFYIQRVTAPWNESTVTWNNKPATTTINQTLVPASTSLYQDFVNMDVAALVKPMVDTPSLNYGFMLRLVTESQYRALLFCSSDYSNPVRRPKLIVKYSGATVSASNGTTFCNGDSSVLSTTLGTYTYQWKKNNSNISGATANKYAAKTTGSYTVKVTGNGGCSVISPAKAITVNSNPSATITPDGPTSFCNGDSVVLKGNFGTGLAYQWKKNNSNISGAITKNYTAKTAGSYVVKVTGTNGCTKLSPSTAVSVPCKESETVNAGDLILSAYPNPTSGEFYLKLDNVSNEGINIRIYDLAGRLTKEMNLNQYTGEIPIGVDNPGLYKIVVIQGKQIKLVSLVKTE